MSINAFIAIAAIVATCATEILVAYWNRKQMRQIEQFRRDSSLGLRPPPSRFWAFVKRHRGLIITISLPSLLLIQTLRQTEPITKWTIFVIAYCIGSIMFALVLGLLHKLLGLVNDIIDVQVAHVGLTKDAISIAADVVKKSK